MKKLACILGVIFFTLPSYAQSTLYSNSSTGDVGIGTTSPQSELQVYGGEVQIGSSGAACASSNAGGLRYSSGSVYVCDGSNWSLLGGSSGGVLPALSSADLWVGNASNVATAVALSGDCSLSNTGAITCMKTNGTNFGSLATESSVVLGTETTGTLPVAQLPSLTNADLWVGSALNAATAVALSGDCSLSNTGAITCTKTNGTSFGTLATQYGINLSSQATGTLQAGQFPALTGDVTTSAGSLSTTVSAIQGTTVSSTTGSGNVVFSASPTLTGTVSGANANWSGNVGIGTTTPQAALHVYSGGAIVGNDTGSCTSAKAGELIWDGSNLKLCDGSSWQTIGTGSSVPSGTWCGIGGNVYGANVNCMGYNPQSGCPSGYSQYNFAQYGGGGLFECIKN